MPQKLIFETVAYLNDINGFYWIMSKFMRKITTLLMLVFSIAHGQGQLTINALEKMQGPFSFKAQNLIAQLMSMQQAQIDAGELTAFQSRCIASNMVVMFGDANAERFIHIAKKAYEHGMETLSMDDINFMQTINTKYMPALTLVSAECSETDSQNQEEDHE